ncbi:FirrV-1-M1 [Feldmannia irregularis virus a]|uniref:FirrV-1-M1 n=1 Tax=Feldmannia irregularis virus a TaxID=231992 RepID=Q6XLT6_9PHYC|nr:FirrV-1-M1 [Feldmannia irregularis virus a]AAR26975.1 FirrV-1-M1 [Feldmannia irregularis virus a]
MEVQSFPTTSAVQLTDHRHIIHSRQHHRRQRMSNQNKKPPFLETVGKLYPQQCLTASGNLPRKYKGSYCAQLFSRVRFGNAVSQKLRRRTVSVGFLAATMDSTRETFQSKVNEAVDHLSRERVLASLFSNFVYMERLRDGSTLPEPDVKFFGSCLSSCIRSKGGSLNADFDRFSSLTGLSRLVPPKHLNLGQQRQFEANQMATSTSTRATHHSEKRRISITRWFLWERISGGNSRPKDYATKLFILAKKIITDFEGTEEQKQKLREMAKALDSGMDPEPIIEFALKEKEFSDNFSANQKCAPTIAHLDWMFKTYVSESRRKYEEVLSRAHSLFPGEEKEISKKRNEFMKRELGRGDIIAPPRDTSVLPICSTGSVFIHVDMKTLKSWGLFHSNDAWWYKNVLRPFSREANIKCLRSRENTRYASSEQGYLSSLLDNGPAKCPWFVGESFLTDGVQIKLLLVTLEHTRESFSGSSQLNEEGYSKLPRADAPLETLLEKGRGVYNISSLVESESIRGDLVVMSADPGQAKVINVCSATSETWEKKDPVAILKTSTCVFGDDYRRETLASHSDEYETLRRRGTSYGIAIDRLRDEKKRTSCLTTFIQYCRSWCANSSALMNETLQKGRRFLRFGRHRATQSILARIADRFMGHVGDICRVMLFGKASFSAKKGRASAPRKRLIREMAARGVVLMVNEYNTSKQCPGCLEDTVEDKERRIRSCINFKVGSPEESCRLHPLTPVLEMDRDDVGSTNIGMRGFGQLLGQKWF